MRTILVSLVLLFSSVAMTDQADMEALRETQKLLNDSALRNKSIQGDQNAQQADAYVKSVAGEKSNEVYGLASKVFEKLVKKYNGDVSKIQEVLNQAAANPEKFAQSEFSTEELKALRELASQLPQPAGPRR